jgi:fructose-1-phosphate kinase PfkB-like protein
VNRAHEVQITAAGRAVNVARVASVLGGRAHLISFLGGDPGRFVARKLDAEGVPHEVVWVEDDAPTRTCTTLLPEDGVGTELVEETSSVSAGHVRKLESAATGHLHEARVLCLISSLPPGVPGDFYARLTKAAHEAHLPCS